MEIRRLRRVSACDDGARHFGKNHSVLCKGSEVKHAFVDRHRHLWPVCVQCRVLGVSATGYHQHRMRGVQIPQRRHMSDEALGAHTRCVRRDTQRVWVAGGSHLARADQAQRAHFQAACAVTHARARHSHARRASLSRDYDR
jgi:hypothetical protein